MAEAARALLSGVIYLHRQNIIHRDIKPENILVDDPARLGSLKLGDFGLSAYRYDQRELQKRIGTPLYMAPEMAKDHSLYDKSIDTWSVGMVLYELCSGGQHPIAAGSLPELTQKLLAFEYQPNPAFSAQANAFLGFILKADPRARPQPYQVLAHSFISQQLYPRSLSFAETEACFEDQQTILRCIRAHIALQKLTSN